METALSGPRPPDDDLDNDNQEIVMSEFIDRQSGVIERSGMGLLPGLGLALVISMGIIGAILFQTWWAIGMALVGIFAVTAVVIAVIVGLLGSDDGIYSSDE